MIESFLLGVIATASLVAALFFFVYWRRSRDTLFLAFAISFAMQSFNEATLLGASDPTTPSFSFYVVRLVAFLILLGGILKKNYGRG